MNPGPPPNLPTSEKLSICQVTMRGKPQDQQLEAVAEAGASGFGVFHPMMPERSDPAEMLRQLNHHGLTASICVPGPFTILPTLTYRSMEGQRAVSGLGPPKSTEAMIDSLRWLAPLEPSSVVVIPGAQMGLSADQAWDQARDGLNELVLEADRLGFDLALEPVHPRFSTDFSIINSIDDALRMISEIGSSRLGVLVDFFHVWDSHDVYRQIERAAGKIKGVHVADSVAYPRSMVDRLPPGEGIADIPQLIAAVAATGYDGWYCCEVVSDDGALGYGAYPDSVWKRPAREIAAACVTGFKEAVAEARTKSRRADNDRSEVARL